MDIFLLVATVIIGLLILLVNVYLLAVYVHPEDRGFGASAFPKILVVAGLTLSWSQVLMVPLDVSNTRGQGGGIDMTLLWQLVIFLAALLLLILLPFALFLYETDETKPFRQRIGSAFTYTMVYFVAFAVVCLMSFLFLNEAEVPITSKTLSVNYTQNSTDKIADWDKFMKESKVKSEETTVSFTVSLPVYIMAIFSFIGWILLVFFGGMGLFAIPLDLINEYKNKPIKRTNKEIVEKKKELQDKIADLIQNGQEIEDSQKDVDAARGWFSKRSAKTKVNAKANEFQASVLSLEQEFNTFAAELNYQNVNPITYTVKFLLGILLFLVSIIWWAHVLSSLFKDEDGFPMSSFLSSILIFIDETLGFSFVSTGIFGVLSIYLIGAVTKGNVKFGLAIPFFFTIHPMKPNETLMNSFLFNVWLILVSSIGVVQFLASTFSQYVRLTAAQFFFGVQIEYMKFFSFFFQNNIFEIAFLSWSIITLFVLCIWSRRKSKSNKKEPLSKMMA